MFPEGRILDFVIVGVVALIVVGPKDLPLLMRRVGQFVARMRAMAAEFRASFDEMARQSELDELRKEVEAMRAGKPFHDAAGLGEEGEVTKVFDDIHTSLKSGDISPAPLASHQAPSLPPVGAVDESDDQLPLFAEPPAVTGEGNLAPAKAAS